MAASRRRRGGGNYAVGQHVLGRTLRSTDRSVWSPLVTLRADQNEQGRERRETEAVDGNVLPRTTSRSPRAKYTSSIATQLISSRETELLVRTPIFRTASSPLSPQPERIESPDLSLSA